MFERLMVDDLLHWARTYKVHHHYPAVIVCYALLHGGVITSTIMSLLFFIFPHPRRLG